MSYHLLSVSTGDFPPRASQILTKNLSPVGWHFSLNNASGSRPGIKRCRATKLQCIIDISQATSNNNILSFLQMGKAGSDLSSNID